MLFVGWQRGVNVVCWMQRVVGCARVVWRCWCVNIGLICPFFTYIFSERERVYV